MHHRTDSDQMVSEIITQLTFLITNSGDSTISILLSNMVAFATVTYTKNIMYSTPVVAILPSKYGLKENESIANSTSRIIYNGSMGLGNFIVESSSFILNDNALTLAKGPFNIKGISTTTGNLVLFRSSYETLSDDKNIIFRFDAYSKNSRTIQLSLISLANKETYSAYINLKGSLIFGDKMR